MVEAQEQEEPLSEAKAGKIERHPHGEPFGR